MSAKKKNKPYKPPEVTVERPIETLAVSCTPGGGYPVKSSPGASDGMGGFCLQGFLNS